jgi:membrane dipeptidase
MPLLLDAHLDLAMNAIEWNRDLSRPIGEIRERERGQTDRPDRTRATVSFDELRRGGVGIVVATQIARYVRPTNPLPGWHSPEQAWAMTQAQLAWYREMERRGELRAIRTRAELDAHVADWTAAGSPLEARLPIGYVRSLEGADSIVTLGHVERAWLDGLRAIGPAHYGPGTYAQGTDATGGIGPAGRALLSEMERLGIILDATHLCDDSFWEALDHFGGRVWASHNNCRALVPHNRQFSDDQIRALAARGAVIGVALDAWMLYPGWQRGVTTPAAAGVTLRTLVDHIDRICQVTGSARHVGIGSDLDGGFGLEQTAADLRTIADLATIPALLRERGYREESIDLVASGNFLRFLGEALPAA